VTVTDLKQIAQAFSAHMCVKFGAHVHPKESSLEMKAIAMGMDIGGLFGASGLASGKDFLRDFTTTIGSDIYMPAAHRSWADPLGFMQILTHECQHVLQFTESNVEFAWLYLKEPEARARYEADAYAAGLAVTQWLTGELPSDAVESIVSSLAGSYSLRPEDAALAADMLRSHMASLKNGIVMSASAREAIAFLAASEPELRHAARG
jgi:hypothetical protein